MSNLDQSALHPGQLLWYSHGLRCSQALQPEKQPAAADAKSKESPSV
jgi:hypothetical protein